MMAGRTRECLAAADQALELCEQLGDEERAVFPRQARAIARCELGELDGLDDLREARRRAVDLGLGRAVAVTTNNLGHFVWLLDAPRPALALKREAIELSEHRGLLGLALWGHMETLWLLFDLGEWDEVLREADELLERVRTGDESQVPAVAPAFQSLVMSFRGRATEVADSPAAFLRVAHEIADPQILVPALGTAAIVAHALGKSDAALANIRELDELTSNSPDWSRLLYALPMLRICRDLGELELGERFFDRPNARGARLEHALVAGRAVIAEAHGETAQAAPIYADAARRWREYELPFEEGHALLGHWRCTADETSLHEARAVFDRLGAVVPQATAEESPRADRRAK